MADAPCEVWFYHLERTGLDQALPGLLEKTLARGWKAVVRTGDPGRIDHLDSWLWTYRDDSFLPHGGAEDASAARQPVLLTAADETPNGAEALFLIDDAQPGDLFDFSRCIFIFDGHDAPALEAARKSWKAFKSAGHPVTYWRQSETRGWSQVG